MIKRYGGSFLVEKEIVDGECMGLYRIAREIVERCGKDKNGN